MVGKLQPLVNNQQIVGPDGTPTQYFIRWAQQRQIDIGEAVSEARAIEIITEFFNDNPLLAGSGINLSPSGNILDGVTISAEAQEILDQISDVQGTVLFRGVDDWEGLPPGTAGQFLKTNGAGADPEWATGGGGGGGSNWTLLNSYDHAVDGNVANFDSLDLSSYSEAYVRFSQVNSSSARVVLLVSVDGSTFLNSSGNYGDVSVEGVTANNSALFGNTRFFASVTDSLFQIPFLSGVMARRPVFLPIRATTQVVLGHSDPILKLRASSADAGGAASGNIIAGTIEFWVK